MLNSDFDSRAARAQQKLSHFGIGLALHRIAVDRENAVAKTQTGTGGWRIRKRRTNVGIDVGALAHVLDRGTDSVVFRALLRTERGVFDRIEVSRMRIEHA